jgi:two-component system chemotaxis response regulator CheY
VATYREDGTNAVELVRKADNALYRAKITGRNKVCLAREEKMVTKTSHYTVEQLHRLTELAKERGVGEAILLREALDDVLKKYDFKKTPPGEAVAPKGKTALLVDDAAFMRMMQREMLTQSGYEVVAEAVDGVGGYEKYNELKPDIVLLDIVMPNMDGVQSLKRMELDEKTRVVVVSALGHENVILEAIEAGADYFIVKPFQKEKLLDAMEYGAEKLFSKDKLEAYRAHLKRQNYKEGDVLSQKEIDALLNVLL